MGGPVLPELARLVLDSWLWTIEHTHFRVLFALVALAAPAASVHRSPLWGTVEVPAGGVVTSLDRLAEIAGVSRAVVRGALARLAGGPARDGADPAIAIAANPRGYTLITVLIPGVAAGSAQPTSTVATAPPAHHQHSEQHSIQHSADPTSTASSTASSTAPVQGMTSSRIDLPASSSTDQHSAGHSEQHADRTPEPADRVGTPGALSDPGSRSDPEIPVTADEEAKARRRVERIEPWHWKAADTLRVLLLEAEPDNIVRTKPWGDDVRSGWRLAWADEIRLMADPKRDGRSKEAIWEAMRWVFKGQTAEPRFRIVVESADALRSKWDQIQRARDRQAAQAKAEAAKPAERKPGAAPSAYSNPPQRTRW